MFSSLAANQGTGLDTVHGSMANLLREPFISSSRFSKNRCVHSSRIRFGTTEPLRCTDGQTKEKRGYRTRNISDVSQNFLNNVKSMRLGRKRGGFAEREEVCLPTDS